MPEIWYQMGFIRYPLSFSVVAIVVLTIYSAARLFGWDARADRVTKAWIDAVLFWGGFAMVAGVMGTILGFIIAAQSIEAAGAVSTTLVWGGIKVALLSAAFGTLVLALSSVVWFGLQLKWRFLEASAADAS